LNSGPRPLRVLIADDHEPTLDDVRRALEGDEAFDICAMAIDAAQAVQAAVRERPDICLLDVRMPGSGIAAAWEIAARLPNVKIVMLTVSENDTDLFAALRAGADGYLLKTMNLKRLRNALIGVHSGEAAIQRALVARVLNRFHGREPRWRQAVSGESSGRRMTSREWQVLELLAQGRSTAEIAEDLALSSSAVRVHISAIVRKFEVADRAALVELFRRTRT
jgi:two-component system nitrate/nitrite response regulator NarL